MFVTIAALGLTVAGALVLLEHHWRGIDRELPGWRSYDSIYWAAAILAVIMLVAVIMLFISWYQVKEKRVLTWLEHHLGHRYKQFGWHVVG
jgi:MFS family permease